jgi:AP endonuclease-2
MRITTWNVNGLAATLQYYPWSETKSFKVKLDKYLIKQKRKKGS